MDDTPATPWPGASPNKATYEPPAAYLAMQASNIRRSNPEYEQGWKAGVQAAWEVVNAMIQTLPAEPITPNAKLMRDTALDVGDNILDLKNHTSR
mgnify:CR=1 FL=1